MARLSLLLAGIACLGLVWIWELSDWIGQDRMMASVPIAAVIVILLGFSLLRVRGPRRRPARIGALLLVAALVALPVLFRIRGVTGDFFPVLEWRFAPPRDALLPALPGVSGPAAAAPALAPGTDRAITQDEGTETEMPEVTSTVGHQSAIAAAAAAAPAPAPTSGPAFATADAHPAAPSRPSGPFATVSFPQFLGPTRTGVIPGVNLRREWTGAPRLLWKIAVGAGWSGFAIDRGVAITQEQRGSEDTVVAYELATGKPLWSHKDPLRYASVIAGDGPRATPTIAGRYVATLGSTGVLNVLDFSTGRRIWRKDVARDNQAGEPQWGRSGSPLILDGHVIVSAGGPDGRSLVAYNLADGTRAWSGGSDAVGYSSPVVLSLLGRQQVVIFNQSSLAGHDSQTGALLWSQPWPAEAPNVAQPVRIADDLVLASTGYGIGSKLVRLTPAVDGTIEPTIVWESTRLKPKFANPVMYERFVYGLDDGVLVCLDPATGERRWKAGRYGHGQTLLVGDTLLVTTEEGEVVLVEPTPERHRELGRFTALDGKTWNPPAVAGRYLLVRNDKEAALYELATRP